MGLLTQLLEQHIQRKRDQEDAQRDLYLKSISSGNLSPLPNPNNDPDVETQNQKRAQQLEYAQGQVTKLAGTKEGKGLVQQFGQVLGHLHKQRAAAQQSQPQQSALSAPLPPQTTEQSPMMPGLKVMQPGNPADTPSLGSVTAASAQSPEMAASRTSAQTIQDRQAMAQAGGLKPGDPNYASAVIEGKVPTPTRLQKATFQKDGKVMDGSYNPETGEFLDQTGKVVPGAEAATASMAVPKPMHYAGPDGQPLVGTYANGKYYDQEGNPLPPGTRWFSAWMTPEQIQSTTWKEVKQDDGSVQMVPVTSETTRTRGATSAPAPPSTSDTPATKPSASPSSSGAPKIGVGKGVTVGGTPPTEVKKAYDKFNASQERYNVMQKAVGPALKGDQQAMINLLANHLGMTMGLQSGARMNQALIEEAMHSTPWLQGMEAKFDSRGYLSGVTLTPQQIQSMVELAQVRLGEDRAAWQRETQASQGGYGAFSPPAPPTINGGGAAAPPPKTADDYLKSIGVN